MKQLRKRTSIEASGWYWALYVIPALLIYLAFMAIPLVDSLRYSFFSGTTGKFIGLGNFKELLADGKYWNAFGNTWYFFLIHMLVQNVLGMLFAILLTQRTMKGMGKYQTIIFLPTTFAVVITGYLWKLLLNPIWAKGLLKGIGLQALAYPYLGETKTALTSIALVSCWQWIGIPTMMFVAALKGISDDLIEVADIEGASEWKIFTKIKLPLIAPVVGMIAILTFVNNFNAFDIVFAMEGANGAPSGATDLIGTLFYRLGIAGEHPVGIPNPNMGAALATLTFIILAIGVIPVLKFTQTKQE